MAQLERKKEAKALLEEEESKTSGRSKPSKAPASKVTRAQIEHQKQREEQTRKAAEKEIQKEADLSNNFVGENPNQMMADLLANEGSYFLSKFVSKWPVCAFSILKNLPAFSYTNKAVEYFKV